MHAELNKDKLSVKFHGENLRGRKTLLGRKAMFHKQTELKPKNHGMC